METFINDVTQGRGLLRQLGLYIFESNQAIQIKSDDESCSPNMAQFESEDDNCPQILIWIWSFDLISDFFINIQLQFAAFGPGDPGSNPGWFAVLNSNKNMSFHCNPATGDTLVVGDKEPLMVALTFLETIYGRS